MGAAMLRRPWAAVFHLLLDAAQRGRMIVVSSTEGN